MLRIVSIGPYLKIGVLALTFTLALPGNLRAQTVYMPYVEETVDGTGNVGVGLAGAVDYFLPQVAYYDATSKDLKYATMAQGIELDTAPRWVVEIVDGVGTDVGEHPSLTLDAAGRPHLSYYNATTGAIMYATRPAAGCSWQIETVEVIGAATPGLITSIAVKFGTIVGPPDVAIAYHQPSTGTLRYASKPGGGTWGVQVVDGSLSIQVGEYASLRFDSQNRPHIAYYDKTNGNLKYAVQLGLALPWTIEVADGLSLDVGQHASIALCVDVPMISYYDVTNHDLKLATRTTNGWGSVTVDAAGDVGIATDLEIDVDTMEPRIAYYSVTSGDLLLASRSGSTWTISAVAILGDNGRYNSLLIDRFGNPILLYYNANNGDLQIADSSIRLEAPQGGLSVEPGGDLVVRWKGLGPVSIELELDSGLSVEVARDVTLAPATVRVPNMVTDHARVILVRSTPYSRSESRGSISIAPGMADRWSRVTVDGLASEVGGYSSLKLDAAGSPRVSYYTFDTFDLKYAAKIGATWAIETVDAPGDVGAFCSLALDGSGNPQIAYYDATNSDLKFATKSGGSWVIEVVDGASADVGWYCSLVGGISGPPAIAYYDVTNGDLKLARKSGSVWTTQVVDGATSDVGTYCSMVRGSLGRPDLLAIAYYDVTSADLKVAEIDGLSIDIEVADYPGDVGRYCSLASQSIGGDPDRLVVAYHDQTNGDLKFAYRVEPGVWSRQVIDAAGTTGRHVSIALDGHGKPYIAYRDVTHGVLKVASSLATPGGPDFLPHIEIVDASADLGAWTSLDLDAYENLKLTYRDITNGDLKYASTAVELADPIPGTVWPVGASRAITWDGKGQVDLSLSVDGGRTWDPVAQAVMLGLHKGEVRSEYRTVVPHSPTKFAQVKVERGVPHSVSITPGLFTIETSVSLLNLLADLNPDGEGALLSWRTDPGPEDLAGYRLERTSYGSGEWRTLLALTRETRYADPGGGPGSRYRLFAVNGLGEELFLGETALRPREPLLAWPLPYRGGDLNIAFATAGGLGGVAGPAEVALFDVRGRLVRRIVAASYSPGYHNAIWDGQDERGRHVAAGVYFLRSASAGIERNMKVVIAR